MVDAWLRHRYRKLNSAVLCVPIQCAYVTTDYRPGCSARRQESTQAAKSPRLLSSILSVRFSIFDFFGLFTASYGTQPAPHLSRCSQIACFEHPPPSWAPSWLTFPQKLTPSSAPFLCCRAGGSRAFGVRGMGTESSKSSLSA